MFQYKAAFLARYAFVDYKVLQYSDAGEWYVEADDGISNNYPHNKILFTPGFVFY
jgi:hypothetical protein